MNIEALIYAIARLSVSIAIVLILIGVVNFLFTRPDRS